ncbi:hypothetical protein HOLleu_04367 [Holothuria leucospilota]|uniref:Uncharacterized protein n=1 Tax=Holothuria leucospilota TaxID=206669 RepID=A0A9Q1CT69_HOLLE|nr:hypothetical protein HOLleu_04367 [Holothuria leucospilota]
MAENMSTTIKTNLRKLRRLSAVPLDLGINKRLKLEEETDSVVPPTPLDENAQPSWPIPENLSEATTFNVSPLEKEAETGSDTTEKNSLVKAWLEANKKETPSDDQAPCDANPGKAPFTDCCQKDVSLRSCSKNVRLVWENLNWLKENAYFKSAPRTPLFHSCGVKLENFALKSVMDVKLITLASVNMIGALWQQMGKG